jgi:Ca2+-dependent lipid-binding protein
LAIKKPVGILHVNVIRARNLLKMDILGTSDPYVKLSLTGDSLPAKKTTIKKNNLNPEWHEKFKLIVKDPQTQVLRFEVYDWDKVFPCFSVLFLRKLGEKNLELSLVELCIRDEDSG